MGERRGAGHCYGFRLRDGMPASCLSGRSRGRNLSEQRKERDAQDLIDVQDVAVIRWPQYAAGPQVQEHVTDEGSKASAFAKKLTKAGIDGSMVESVKGDMAPGTSALVLLSADAAIDTV